MKEIARQEPRSFLSLFFACWGGLAIGLAVVTIALTAVSAWYFSTALAFEERGVPITAEVVARDRRRGDSNYRYYLTFRYTPPERVYAIEHHVSKAYYDRHQIGQSVTIYYLPDDPARMQIHKAQFEGDGLLFQVLAGGTGVIGCLIFWLLGRLAARGIAARRFGERVIATVTKLVEVPNKSSKDSGQRIIHWVEPDGRKGFSLPHPKDYAQRWDVGDRIAVFRGSKGSWWEGDVGPRETTAPLFPVVQKKD